MWRPIQSVALVGVLLVGLAGPARAQGQEGEGESERHLAAALATQATTRRHLRVLGDAFECAEARLVAYRRSTEERELTDQWYVASQLWADAVLILAAQRAPAMPDGWDAEDTRCHVDKGFAFLDRLWDYSAGGYYARSNPVGTRVEIGPHFGDDNALAGLALLTAAATTEDSFARRRYVHAAERQADFMRESNLWDDTFGGGFWWNTGRGDSPEGKPAQTNSLAALFFARLYGVTGNPVDREWALRTLLWLDTFLYNPSGQAYRWSVAFEDIPRRSGARISDRYFSYDQAIAIEAQLEAYKLDGDAARLERARSVGRSLDRAFWSEELGGFNLEAGVEQVFTSFSAWSSLGHLALYNSLGDAEFLSRAQAGADRLAARVRAPDGGYGVRAYVCVDRLAPGCEAGDRRLVVETTVDGAAGAWAQHLETLLAISYRG